MGEHLERGAVGVVAGDEPEARGEPGERVVIDARVLADGGDHRVAGVLAERLVVPRAAGHADDREVVGQLAVALELIERRHQLALGQVAGCSEEHERVSGLCHQV